LRGDILQGKVRVIPAIRDVSTVDLAAASPSKIVFILSGSIMEVEDVVLKLKKKEKIVFVHIDLVKGLKTDKFSLEFLKERVGADGIISTHIALLKQARKMGLHIIQRLFLVDSNALMNGISQANDLAPDFLEVLPGVSPELIKEVCSRFSGKVIAGGLVRTKEHVKQAIKAGAVAVSTSKVELWNLQEVIA